MGVGERRKTWFGDNSVARSSNAHQEGDKASGAGLGWGHQGREWTWPKARAANLDQAAAKPPTLGCGALTVALTQ